MLCNVRALITNGILQLGELAEEPDEAFTAECTLDLHFASLLTHTSYTFQRETRASCVWCTFTDDLRLGEMANGW